MLNEKGNVRMRIVKMHEWIFELKLLHRWEWEENKGRGKGL